MLNNQALPLFSPILFLMNQTSLRTIIRTSGFWKIFTIHLGIVERVKAEGGPNKNASSSLDSTNISLDSVKSFQIIFSNS